MKQFFTLVIFTFLVSNLFSQTKVALGPYWDNGLKLESHDKNFSVKLGGRIQYDIMFINQDDSLNNHFDAENGAEFRRARLYTSGTIYKWIKYKFQVDFALNRVVIKDAYLRFTKIPWVGNFTVGNFKEPRGLEMLTSSNNITMMERSITNEFDNDRSLGFMLNNSFLKDKLSLFAGYFYPSENNTMYSGSNYHLTFRAAGLPYYKKDDGLKLVHLGAGYSYEHKNNDTVSYNTRPESHLAPKYLSVELDAAQYLQEINGEILIIFNSLSLQAEYTIAVLNISDFSALQSNHYSFYSLYGNLSWFITGEHKNYKKKETSFSRLSPKKNFDYKGGIGAIELSLRYSTMNLDYKDINGGKMNNLTFGINWYLNPVTRITFNYINSSIYNLGVSNIFQMRFQVVF